MALIHFRIGLEYAKTIIGIIATIDISNILSTTALYHGLRTNNGSSVDYGSGEVEYMSLLDAARKVFARFQLF